jgi:hypothetical protein
LQSQQALELTKSPNLAVLTADCLKVKFCEIQYDRKKMIVFVEVPGWVDFREFVSALHTMCALHFGCALRIFIQRKITGWA